MLLSHRSRRTKRVRKGKEEKRKKRTHRPVCGYPCNSNNPSPFPLVLTYNSTSPGGWVEETVIRVISNVSRAVIVSTSFLLYLVLLVCVDSSCFYIDIRGEVEVESCCINSANLPPVDN
jgi:hypothetical protein